MPRLGLEGAFFSYPGVEIMRDLSLEFGIGEVSVLLGPSGCGKTSLLRVIAGLEALDSGFAHAPPGIPGYVFQEPRLLPWASAWANLDFALSGSLPKAGRDTRIEEVLGLVGLLPFKDALPSELSGGMKQRLAIARAFALESPLILLDEAFKGLDPARKASLARAFLKLWERRRPSCIAVTHDVREAVLMADEVFVLSGPPLSLKARMRIGTPKEGRGTDPGIAAIESELYRLLESDAEG
jgi:NitT/TauT family transport system ATP-binding protein